MLIHCCAWLENERPRVRASLASLRCCPWARHIYPSLVLVQPRKTRPCLTERLLMGRKESNQTNYLTYLPIYSKKIIWREYSDFCLTSDRRQSKILILSTNVDQNIVKTEFSIAIFRPTGDKWQSKTLFLSIFDPRSSIVKSVFDCHLYGAILVTNDFETLRTGYAIILSVR